ncbi:MAG: homoserine O-acetyltransferase [Phycisphaerae bacterium]
MTDSFLDSSDSVRSGRPLKYVKTVKFRGPIKLELGGRLPEVTVAYETYGRLSPAKDNAVLVCHAISGDSHVARHDEADDPGWWDIAVGPGKPIDTDKYYVICPNILGGCRGTTGPGSTNPATGRPYGRDFPTITVGDMVDVQARLIDALGIPKLLAVTGGSMGGHQTLAWATKYPDKVRGAMLLATSARLTMQALAFDVVGRNAIIRDPNFSGGQYYDQDEGPDVGLAIARMIGHITYLSPEAMRQKFEADRLAPRDVATEFEKKFSVGSYLGYQGDKFVERFDANSYITLSMAMDLFDMGGTTRELSRALAPAQCRWLVVSYTSDWLFPPRQSRDIVAALLAAGKPVAYCNVASACGHDAFLLEDDIDRYGELMRGFLGGLSRRLGLSPVAGEAAPRSELVASFVDAKPGTVPNNGTGKPGTVPDGGTVPEAENGDEDAYGEAPTSIFHRRRLDYDMLVDLIPPDCGVLDLGCGKGTLLSRLKARCNSPLVGVELDEQAILACVRRGLDVIHADLNNGLAMFGDGQFDCVVLSQTLQAVRDVERIVTDMLRVGRQCIVSFPNFAYHKLRKMLTDDGKAPESAGQLRFKWYNSPNIRFFSIADFEDFCREKSIRVHKRIALDTEAGTAVEEDPNRNADVAIFVISR